MRLTTLLLMGLSGVLAVNLAWFRRPRGTLPSPAPRVSVLVPARNEARNIEPCVRSLLAQDYPAAALEIIVLDDQSEDATPAILARLQAEAPCLRVVQGVDPPPGWVGKPWACHTLSRHADPASRWLLFTDADTRHAPSALGAAVAEAERDRLGLLSLFPQQLTATWPERMVVPLLAHQIIGYLPLPLLELWPNPAYSAANGQYMLFDRAVYDAIDGHAVAPGRAGEDVALARAVKAAGRRVRLANGAGLVQCRMYQSWGEIERGFARSFGAGFQIDPVVTSGLVLSNIWLFLLPCVWLPLGWVRRARWRREALFQVAAILGLRAALARRTATPLRDALWHPLGMAALVLIQLRAFHDVKVRKRWTWRGREYSA